MKDWIGNADLHMQFSERVIIRKLNVRRTITMQRNRKQPDCFLESRSFLR